MTEHCVMFSSGMGSFIAAKRVVERHGKESVVLLFADTLIEDEDNYRFLRETSEHLGAELAWIKEGRSVWEVLHDVKMIGGNQADPCSRILKRDLCKDYVQDRWPMPDLVTLHFGIGWTESHRSAPIEKNWSPYRCDFPLMWEDAGLLSPAEMREQSRASGIEPPRLYDEGFPHANCGGACVKAGQAQWRLLLKRRPDTYRHWEEQESIFNENRRKRGKKPVAILRDRRGGKTKPLPLGEFRERQKSGQLSFDETHEWGGCGCFTDD